MYFDGVRLCGWIFWYLHKFGGLVKKYIPVIIMAVLLSSCSASMMTTEYLDSAGNVFKKVIEPIADASVQRDNNFHKSIQNRDNARKYLADKPLFETGYINSNIEIHVTGPNGETVSHTSITMPLATTKVYRNIAFENALPEHATQSEWVGVTKDIAKYTVVGVLGYKAIDSFTSIVNGAITASGMHIGDGGSVVYNQSLNSGAGNVAGPTTSSEYLMSE